MQHFAGMGQRQGGKSVQGGSNKRFEFDWPRATVVRWHAKLCQRINRGRGESTGQHVMVG